jgi:hypothetical protein
MESGVPVNIHAYNIYGKSASFELPTPETETETKKWLC